MTPEKQRIKIAEASQGSIELYNQVWYYWSDSKRHPCKDNDPLKDLNAMHDVMSIFDYDQADEFEDHLCDICKRSNDKKDNPVPWRFAVVNATAAQRARVFLETLGLWENGSD